MNDIDNIFSKLKDSQVQTPEIWSKLESKLGNNPNSNIGNNLGKVNIVKTIVSNSIFKTIGFIACCGVIGLLTYLIVDNNKENIENKISKKRIETPKTYTLIKNNNDNNTIQVERTHNFNNANNLMKTTKEELIVEYSINDEQNIVIQNNNFSIKKLNSNQTVTPEIIINNKKEDDTLKYSEKAPLPIQEILIFKASNVITPNGDGINDFFVIKNIDKFLQNSLIIFDNKGRIVYRCKGYKNNFDAVNIPIGTYFYKFEYNNLGKKERQTGSITIM